MEEVAGAGVGIQGYSPDQWRKLSAEDKKKVYDGRQKSANKSMTSIGTPAQG
jgi:hypothetical protein